MCNKREFHSKVRRYQKLRLAKQAIEDEMNELKAEMIDYVKANGIPSTESDSTIYVMGADYKVLYITSVSEKLDSKKLKEALGEEKYAKYLVPTSSHQLRVN